MVKHCRKCGMDLKENSKICDNCGSHRNPSSSDKNYFKIIILAVIIIIIVIIVAYASTMVWYSYEEDDNGLSNLGYINNEYGFGLNPPAGWTKDRSGAFGLIVIFYSPTEDDFADNINVISDSLDGYSSLTSYMDLAISQSYDMYTDYSVLDSGLTTVNGMNAYELVYTNNQGIYDLKGKQYVVEKNSKLIILTYSAEIDIYDIYSSEFEQCINSLKIV